MDTWESKFRKFHRENPLVYDAFKRLAFQIKATGREVYGAWTIFNVIRWEYDIKTKGGGFKINNNYIAFYSRMLVKERPEFEGFFRMRAMIHG